MDNLMNKTWLTKQITVEEQEHEYLASEGNLGSLPVNERWQKLKSQIRHGDELWEFCSPKETWENLMGRKGLWLVRDGEVVYEIISLMN
jgi:hypothetical protein